MQKIILPWLASLILVAGITSVFTRAQTRPVEPRVLSGNDLGFRVDGTDVRTGYPTGTLVIRINGEWVETSAAPSVKRVK